LDCPDGELSILLVDNRRIRELNREYRGRDAPTNVLSFSMREGDFPEISPRILGDVVISTETAEAEAEKAGIGMEQHMIWLLIHGVLHLFGFDHEKSQKDAADMEARTAHLMQKIQALFPGDFQ